MSRNFVRLHAVENAVFGRGLSIEIVPGHHAELVSSEVALVPQLRDSFVARVRNTTVIDVSGRHARGNDTWRCKVPPRGRRVIGAAIGRPNYPGPDS